MKGPCGVWGVMWLLCVLAPLQAQPAPTEPVVPPPPMSVSVAVPAQEPAPAPPSASILLPNAQGQLVPLARTPLLEEVLRALAQRGTPPAESPLPASVSRLLLDGSSDGNRVTLKCQLQIEVLPDQQWVKLPLQFQEAQLKGFQAGGVGQAVPGGFDPTQGYWWWFYGAGTHTLDLELQTAVRKELPLRRMSLSLPPTVVSQLMLTVSQPNAIAKTDERTRLNIIPGDATGTRFELIGLGTRVDVSWQPQSDPTATQPSLEVRTSIIATVDGESTLLEANQRLTAQQGSFQEVKVRLPRGGLLEELKGPLYRDHQVDPQDPTQLTVYLKEPISGANSADLKWTVRVEQPPESAHYLIEGFEVAGARIQTGHIGLAPVGDFRLAQSDQPNQYVKRDNASLLAKVLPPLPTTEGVKSAYNILRQPFRLNFKLQREQPHVTAKPRLFLNLTGDRAELTGFFDVQVYRGSIEEILFHWPDWKTEGWQIDAVDPPSRVEQTDSNDPTNQGVIRVRLIERATGPTAFQLTFRATRPFPAGQAAQPLTLPSIRVQGDTASELVVSLADNLEIELRPTGETATRFRATTYDGVVPVPASLAELRQSAYTISSHQPTLSVGTTVQKQRVTAQSEVQLTPQGGTLDVQQQLEFDIAYERMSQVLLMVHESVLDRCRFVSAQGTNLVAIPTGLAEGAWRQHRLALESAQLGTVKITALYSLERPKPLGNASLANLIVPLVRSSDAPFTGVRLRLIDGTEPRLNLNGDGWTPQPSRPGSREWTASSAMTQISLATEAGTPGSGWGIRVSRQLFHAYFDPQGSVAGRAWYRVVGNATSLRLQLAEGMTLSEMTWDGQRLSPGQWQEVAGQSGLLEITLPPATSDSEHLLTVVYLAALQKPLALSAQREWPVPHLLAEEGLTQSLWLLHLPATHHLWTPPATLAAEYNWQWGSWHWRRFPRHSLQDLQQWLGTEDDTLREAVSWQGHLYEFSSYEPRWSVRFTTLSRELIILLGAGLALAGGFVLVNFPATRHVLTFLSLGFLGTLTAIWYEEPVLVLLQPAVLGVSLSVMAAVWQAYWRRPKAPSVLTVGPSSSLLAESPTVAPETPRSRGLGETATYLEPQNQLPPPQTGVAL